MNCIGKEENVPNLLEWLSREASLRSRIRKDTDYQDTSDHRIPLKSDNHAVSNETSKDEAAKRNTNLTHARNFNDQQSISDGR